MKEINWQRRVRPVLRVNGTPFQVLVNETEVLEMAGELQRLSERTETGENAVEAAVSGGKAIVACVDRMLGEGAYAAITGGGSVSVRDAGELFSTVARGILDEYAALTAQLYE